MILYSSFTAIAFYGIPLNDKLLKNIKPTIKRYKISDSGGFSIRVSPNGSITFQYRFRIEGKQFRMDFGSYPDFSLAKARKLHRLARNEVSLGKNPIEEKRERALLDKQAITVADLVDQFMAKEIRGRLKRKHLGYADSILRNK